MTDDPDVFEIDERFIPLATIDTVVKYMNSDNSDELVRKLVLKKKIAKKTDEDFELTVDEAIDMLYELSLRVINDFISAPRH